MKGAPGTLLLALFLLAVPFPASAQSSDGCTSAGPSCTSSTGYSGTCAQNPENGSYYCRPSVLGPSSSGGGGGGLNLGFIQPYANSVIDLINFVLVPVLFAVAFITFLWGVFKYFIWGRESESDKMEGRKYVLWGIVGFVVILAVWGLVYLVLGALNLPTNIRPTPPML